MLTYSKIKEILPHAVYNRKEKKFDLYLDVKMKEEITVGFGGNVSSYQANQLFLGLGYQYLRRYAADVNANFQVGNSFSGVMLNGRIYLQTRIPTYLNWQGVFSDKNTPKASLCSTKTYYRLSSTRKNCTRRSS